MTVRAELLPPDVSNVMKTGVGCDAALTRCDYYTTPAQFVCAPQSSRTTWNSNSTMCLLNRVFELSSMP